MAERFYNTKEWHRLRTKTKAHWRRSGQPCAYGHQPLDWADKPTVDHIKNRLQYPHLALEPSNLCVVHHTCNSKKAAWVERNDKPAIGLDGYPEGWV